MASTASYRCYKQICFADLIRFGEEPFAQLSNHQCFTAHPSILGLARIEPKKTISTYKWTFNILSNCHSSSECVWIGMCSTTNKYYAFSNIGKKYSHDRFHDGVYGGIAFKAGDRVQLKLDCSGKNNMKLSLFHQNKGSEAASFRIKKTSTYRLMVKIYIGYLKPRIFIEMVNFEEKQIRQKVEEQKDTFVKKGAKSKKSNENKNKSVKQLKTENAKLRQENAKLKKTIKRVETENVRLNKQIDSTQLGTKDKSEINNLKADKHKLQQKLVLIKKENMKLMNDYKETKLELRDAKKQIIKLRKMRRWDTTQYLHWSSDQFVDWIISLENGKYQPYEHKLRTQFKKEGVNGKAIPHIDRAALNHWGIQNFMDRANLDTVIKRLVSHNEQQRNNEGIQGCTAYI